MCFGGIFDYDVRKERLAEVEAELSEPDAWNEPERAQALGRKRSSLEQVVRTIKTMDQGLADCRELIDLAVEENDEASIADVEKEAQGLEAQLAQLEFRRMFSGETDPNGAYLDI